MQTIEVKVKGMAKAILVCTSVKHGKQYTSYMVSDYCEGKRKRWTFANPEEAKAKAREILAATATGQTDLLSMSGLKRPIQNALDLLAPTGVAIDRAASIFADAIKLVGPDEIVAACRYFREHRPGQLIPKPTGEVVDEFLARQKGRISARRLRTDTSYMTAFKATFGDCPLHEVQSLELSDFVDKRGWGKRTSNDFLNSVGALYKWAILRKWSAANPASSESIKRFKLKGGTIGIFTPDEGRKMLNGVDDSLKPFLAIWCLSGCRKEEASRLTWEQISAGLASGAIYLRADQTKTGEARSVPICDALRAWLMKYRKATGRVLPPRWQGRNEVHQMERLDEVSKYVARKTGTVWQDNGPRHTYATMHVALFRDPRATVKAMGTSLQKLEKHYMSRADTVTSDTAKEWFEIAPSTEPNIVPFTAPSSQSVPAPGPEAPAEAHQPVAVNT
jgi:integrase